MTLEFVLNFVFAILAVVGLVTIINTVFKIRMCTDNAQYCIGDVVVYRKDGGQKYCFGTVHAIIKIETKSMIGTFSSEEYSFTRFKYQILESEFKDVADDYYEGHPVTVSEGNIVRRYSLNDVLTLEKNSCAIDNSSI